MSPFEKSNRSTGTIRAETAPYLWIIFRINPSSSCTQRTPDAHSRPPIELSTTETAAVKRESCIHRVESGYLALANNIHPSPEVRHVHTYRVNVPRGDTGNSACPARWWRARRLSHWRLRSAGGSAIAT